METKKRLIDANTLLENVKFRLTIDHEYAEIVNRCVDITRRIIENAPTVDAVEVVHGRWNTEKCDHVPWRIKNPEKWVIHKCSVCGYSNGRKHSNYCPNCGAKMDGGNEDG